MISFLDKKGRASLDTMPMAQIQSQTKFHSLSLSRTQVCKYASMNALFKFQIMNVKSQNEMK